MTEETRPASIPRLAWIVGVLGLALAVVGAVLLVLPARGVSGESAESKQVVSRVKDFATAYNTYDVADPEDYQQRLSGLLTSDYQAEFVKITDALFEAIKDKKQRSDDAKVLDVAVESIDDDSAVALAVVDAKVTNTDNESAILRQFRWTVDLQKVAGQWRVSQFESVAAQPADAGDSSDSGATPSPTASSGPSPTASASPTEEESP